MNKKPLLSFLTMLSFLTGCTVHCGGGHPTPQPADVTFHWTFVGKSCADLPEIQTIQIDIPGEALDNNGAYPCESNNYPGIVLHTFAPGTYNFTITAYGTRSEALFTASSSFSINGTNILVNVDLTPVNQPNSWAYLTWTFPAQSGVTRPCFDRGIAFVDVQIDSLPSKRYNCDDGITAQGVATDLLDAGQHSIQAWAVDTNNYVYYSAATSITTYAGSPTGNSITLNWAVGGAAEKWSLYNNTTPITCQNAGVDTMYATFQDVSNANTILYGNLNDYTTWDKIDNFCTNFTYLYWSYLPPGTYKVYLRAIGVGGITYDSDFASPPTVTITAGVFPTEAQAGTVTMHRTQ